MVLLDVGREIDSKFIEELRKMRDKFKLNPAGEGGEFESLVLNCPLFKRELKIVDHKVLEDGENSAKLLIQSCK